MSKSKLVFLDIILGKLDKNLDIYDKDKRIQIQKSIYIAQMMGVNMGYHYRWYVNGPYSGSLADDYYELNKISTIKREADKNEASLNTMIESALEQSRKICKKPVELEISETHWLELITSWHCLRKTLKFNFEEAKRKIESEKNHFIEYVCNAESAIRKYI